MADKQKKPHQDVLWRLVHDLETKKTLCRVKDYPGVELEQLNLHVQKIGPLMNPAFGEQPAFFIDEGHFIPIIIVVHGNAIVVLKIAGLLDHWIEWSRHGGRGTTSKGAFVLEQHPTRPAVRMPDVAYTPRDDDRNLDREQVWTYREEPFTPSFVVEIDKLSGEDSQRDALDRKMRNEYFRHGVVGLVDRSTPRGPHDVRVLSRQARTSAMLERQCVELPRWWRSSSRIHSRLHRFGHGA